MKRGLDAAKSRLSWPIVLLCQAAYPWHSGTQAELSGVT
jgi:hypothetical protein